MPKFLRPTEKIGIAENERVRKKHLSVWKRREQKLIQFFYWLGSTLIMGEREKKKDKKSCKKATYEDFYYCKFLP